MKLIPITSAPTWKSEFNFESALNYKTKRTLMTKFMRPLRYLISCLNRDPRDMAHFNLVLKENIQRAIRYDDIVTRIDYSRFIVSKGKLPMPRFFSVKSHEPGTLLFSWNDNSGRRKAYKSDYLFVALFHHASQRWYFEVDVAMRSDGEFKMKANSMEGQTVHVYAGFASQDSCRVSTSVHLGTTQIMRKASCLSA